MKETINDNLDYWYSKGKDGKKCIIYFCDDIDGILSCIIIRNYLLNKGFEIVGYGVINKQEKLKNIEINNKFINIVLDYIKDEKNIDIYIDNYGNLVEDNNNDNEKSKKIKTNSIYELVSLQLGLSIDSLILDIIDMTDGTKYEFYDVDIEEILEFNLQDILKNKNSKLIFAGIFNQIIKRSNNKTLIEVAHNANLSINNIFLMFKKLYSKNIGINAEEGEDINRKINKVKGESNKKIYLDQNNFYKDFWNGSEILNDGYQIIGNLVFVPNGIWSNILRVRSIINDDLKNNEQLKEHNIYFILLQYNNSLQISDLNGIDNIPEEELPILKNGEVVNNLGDYTYDLLESFRLHLDYSKTITRSNGYKDIGNIYNIIGKIEYGPYKGINWIDLFKNKIINDLSGINWSIKMLWNSSEEYNNFNKVDDKLLMIDQIRTI